MTTQEIQEKIKEIEAASGDPERAHRLEDGLFIDFIGHVSNKPQDPNLHLKAEEVLKSLELIFERWYA